MDLNKLAINNWVTDFEVVKVLYGLFDGVVGYTTDKSAIARRLDFAFADVDLTKSFRKKIIIIFDETLFCEVLTEMQQWLMRTRCKIENIIVITTHTIGASDWYYKYLKLYGLIGFKLIEAPLMSDRYIDRFKTFRPFTNFRADKNLKYYFSFYGGAGATSFEKDFLTTLISSLEIGFVDFLAGYVTTDSEFDGYLEYLTRFSNRKKVDELLLARKEIKIKYDTEKKSTKIFQIRVFNIISIVIQPVIL